MATVRGFKGRDRSRGLTMVEMAVSVAITAIIASGAVRMGSEFVDQASRRQVRELLQTAHHKAMSAAIKNASALPAGEANSIFCIGSDHRIRVFTDDNTLSTPSTLPTACESTSGTPVWTGLISGGEKTTINQANGSKLVCMAFDKTGKAVDRSMAAGSCSKGSSAAVARGGKSITVNWVAS